MSTPPTSILSWQQQVVEADPDWARAYLQPWIYEMSNGRLFYATIPMYGAAAASGLINDGGLLVLTDPTGYPTSDAGLSPYQVWSDGLAVAVVPGGLPRPASPIYFSGVTASQLLLWGAVGFPTSPPTDGSGQLWNNRGLVCVA